MKKNIIIPFKTNAHEAHDRLKHLVKDQSENVYQGVENCIRNNPLALEIQDRSPYVYIFAHARTHDNGVDKVLYWDPRLSIPEAQTNSYLFRVNSHTDNILVVWMIPPHEMWSQYKQGNVTESNWVLWSIKQFTNNKKDLERPHPEDMPEERSKLIMQQIVNDHRNNLKCRKIIDIFENMD